MEVARVLGGKASVTVQVTSEVPVVQHCFKIFVSNVFITVSTKNMLKEPHITSEASLRLSTGFGRDILQFLLSLFQVLPSTIGWSVPFPYNPIFTSSFFSKQTTLTSDDELTLHVHTHSGQRMLHFYFLCHLKCRIVFKCQLTVFTYFNGTFPWSMIPLKINKSAAFGNKIVIKPMHQYHGSVLHELDWWTVEHNFIKKKGAL